MIKIPEPPEGEKMAVRGEGKVVKEEEGARGDHSSSWADRASDFIDGHLRVFRAVPWCLGGLGVLLVLRHSPLVSKPSDDVIIT